MRISVLNFQVLLLRIQKFLIINKNITNIIRKLKISINNSVLNKIP